MFASIESFFIFLLIAGGSALFNWLKQRNEQAEDLANLPPSAPQKNRVPPPIPPSKKPRDWEEELRRVLEGAVPSTRTPQPPPPVPRQKSPPPPPRPQTQAPPPEPSLRYYRGHCNHCGNHIEFPASAMGELATCPHCQELTVLRPFQDTTVEALSHQKSLTSLAPAASRPEAQMNFSEKVAAHMHAAAQAPAAGESGAAKKLWPEVEQTKALFSNAKTVRQAMIASLILGPPKAMETRES